MVFPLVIWHTSQQKEIMKRFALRKNKLLSHDLFSSYCKQNLSTGVAAQDLVLLKFQATISSYHTFSQSVLTTVPAPTLPSLKFSSSVIRSQRNVFLKSTIMSSTLLLKTRHWLRISNIRHYII